MSGFVIPVFPFIEYDLSSNFFSTFPFNKSPQIFLTICLISLPDSTNYVPAIGIEVSTNSLF